MCRYWWGMVSSQGPGAEDRKREGERGGQCGQKRTRGGQFLQIFCGRPLWMTP